MLAPMPMRRRRPPPPEILLERTTPDAPSAQITAVGSTAGAASRLVVTAGPRKGAEFVLFGPLTTVGRGPGNGVAIADLSMSRRHSRLEKQASGWVVSDQGSGNGTRVNGRRVDRRPLRHGDEIELGDTCLRFLEPDGVIAWNARAGTGSLPGKAHLYGAAIAALAIVVAAGLVRQSRLRAWAEAEARAGVLRAAARARLQEGVALGKLGKWSEARDKLRVAAELDPRDPEVARSLQSAEAETLRLQAEAEAPRASPATAAAPSKAAARLARAGAGTRPIVAAYLAGDVALALRRARGARTAAGRRLAALLERFAAAYRTGTSEPHPALAVRALEDAADADRAIALGRKSRPGREAGKALGDRHLLLARELPGDDALPQAAAHLRAAVQSDPGNGEARAELGRLAGRAREIYLRAYLAKDGDPAPARRAFALVAQALPAADETGEKARRWLAKLAGKAAQ